MSFSKIIEFTLKWEGGYVDDKDDKGGETKYGISKKSYPNENIKDLTIARAKEIYERDYWNPFEDIADDNLRMVCFDRAVNMGVGRVRTFLTTANTAAELIGRSEAFYHGLVVKNPAKQKYLKGWLNRTSALRRFVDAS